MVVVTINDLLKQDWPMCCFRKLGNDKEEGLWDGYVVGQYRSRKPGAAATAFPHNSCLIALAGKEKHSK